jgi:sugar fermentation stimulation protein A
VRIDRPLVEGVLVRRYKRFLADVELRTGELVTAHCPDPGRMTGCLPERARVVLRDSQDPRRKLRYTLQTVRVGRSWVNVDTALANPAVAEAVEAGAIPELAGYSRVRREVPYGDRGRIDLLLERRGRAPCFVEVKCTTLAERGVARFPDAVTARGRRQLGELARVAERGERAVVLFLAGRSDVLRFTPADEIDPAYGEALRDALRSGVEALAWSARVRPDRLELARPLAIDIAPSSGRAGARRARRG